MNNVLDHVSSGGNQFTVLQNELKGICSKLGVIKFISMMTKFGLLFELLFVLLALDLIILKIQEDYTTGGLQGIWLSLVLLSCYALLAVLLLYSTIAAYKLRKYGLPDLRKKLAGSSLAQELNPESPYFEELVEEMPEFHRARIKTFQSLHPQKQGWILVIHLDCFLKKPKRYHFYGLLITYIVVCLILEFGFSFLPGWEYITPPQDSMLLTYTWLVGVWVDRKSAKAVELKNYLCPDD